SGGRERDRRSPGARGAATRGLDMRNVVVSVSLPLASSGLGADVPCDEIARPIVIEQPLRLLFTRDVLAPDNTTLTRVLTPRDPGVVPRVLVCWDEGLA